MPDVELSTPAVALADHSFRERLAASAAQLRQVAGPLFAALENSAMAMVVSDPRMADNPIIFVNRAFTDLTGYHPHEALGRNCRFLQGPETDPGTIAAIAASLRKAQSADVSILNYRRNGSAFWNQLSISPIPGSPIPGSPLQDSAALPLFYVASQVDVTSAYQAKIVERELESRLAHLDHINGRFDSVFSVADAAVTWHWHVADKRITGDAAFARLYGLKRGEAEEGVPGRVFFSIIHPEDRDRVRLSIGAMLRGAEVLSKEFRIVGEDGTIRWRHARGRCQYDALDRPIRCSGVLVDITDQKRLQEQLRIAQTAGGVGTFEHVEGFATVSVSEQFCRLLGLHPAADLPVRTLNALVHPDDPPMIDASVRAEPGSASRVEFRITRPDTGELRWLTRRGEHLRDAETAGTRFSGVVYDITDAKQIETKLRTLNETLESRVAARTRERDRIWRVSPDLLGVADLAGRWLSINPAWQTLLDWTEPDILGRTFGWLEHPDDQAAHPPVDANAVAAATPGTLAADFAGGQKIWAFENRLRQRDGTYRRLSWWWTAVADEGLLYCVGRDITAERASAEALRQAEDKLRQSQKMEAVGQLTGGLAHDFNNLLTGIMGSLDLLQFRLSQGRIEDAERYISSAQAAAKRAAALTHRLLAFSRRQTLSPKPTNLNRLVNSMEDLIRRTVGPAIKLEVIPGARGGHTLVDPNQLENALLNLCINARDAMPEGGRLTIETREHHLDAQTAGERDLPPGDYLALCVSDTGIGMTPEIIARAFDPFFTTKPIGQGTGLGLSMIYGFARQSGGEVVISSVVGRGSTVSISLPRHVGASDDGPLGIDGLRPPASRHGETVLVVEDEQAVRMFVVEVLEHLGYHVLEAADGQAGVAILRSAARIDLLVTDFGLPGGMNGRHVAEAGRALRPKLKVLFITGYAENAALGHFDTHTGMHVLTKPFTLDVLTNRIKTIIGAL